MTRHKDISAATEMAVTAQQRPTGGGRDRRERRPDQGGAGEACGDDLQPVRGADQISVGLRLLTAGRTDLMCQRVPASRRWVRLTTRCSFASRRAPG